MKKFIKENQDNLIIAVVSIVAFIIGCLSIGPLLSLVIIGICDVALFLPNLLKKNKVRGRHESIKKPVKTKTGRKGKGKKTSSKKRKIIKTIIIICLVGCILVFVAMGLFVAYIISNAGKFEPENLYKQESSVLYDINGDLITTLGTENRELVTYDQLPEVLVNAIVATEDARFFQHDGVDWARFLKATFFQLLGKKDAGGASTLTMQISKNDFTDKTSTGIKGIIRKFTDVYISLEQIEKSYTKEEIMEFYVNSYYLGGGAYGVEQACQTYFGKSVSEINLAEASVIAGLFQAPGSYDPFVYPEKTQERRKIVLTLMVRHGYITEEEKEMALAIPVEDLIVESKKDSEGLHKYQAFIDTVIEDVIANEGEENSPYKVAMEIYTTMDPEKQDHINDIMNGESWKWENDTVTAGIAAIDVKTGALAAVGAGREKVKRSYNNATRISRQIGSTAKPLYDYGPGIEYENWSTYQPFVDEPYEYSDGTKLNNWDVKYEGFLSARNALAHSRNISALKAFQANKNSNIKEFVLALGLHPEVGTGTLHESHSIGGYNGESPLSMAAAYSAFANGGYYVKPYSYTKIVYRESGEEVNTKTTKTKVMGEDTAYMIYDMLITTGKYALGGQSNINGATFGAKTGTSNFDDETKKLKGLPDSAINDYWVTGVSPDYAISVWYGYKKTYSNKKKDEDYCKNCYNTINEIYHRKLFQTVAKGFFVKSSKIEMPDNVVKVEVENETYPAQLPSEYTPGNMKVTELFKKGTEPTETSSRYARLNNVTNLKGTVNGNTLSLSWTPIATPSAIDESALTTFFKTFWENTKTALSARQKYNKSTIGNLVYRVYAKDAAGKLTLLKTTSDDSIELTINSSSATTYVVKSSYSIFTSNMSSGAETTVSLNGVTSEITASLNGTNPYTWTGSYTESGVKVLENGVDVTAKATVTTKYTKNGTEVTAANINTSGTYVATYNISYSGFTKTLTRTIVIP